MADHGYGFAGHIGIGLETTWGTAVAASEYFEAMSESVALSIDRFETRNIFGGYYEPDDAAGVHRVAGDIVLAGFPEAIGYPLAAVMGKSATVSLAANLHVTTFTMRKPADGNVSSAAPLPARTLEIFRDVTSAQQIGGVQFASMQIAGAINQDLRVTASVIGKSVTNITPTTPSFPGSSTDPFTFDTASVSIGGVGDARMESFNLSIDNQLEGVPSLNASNEIDRVRRTGPQMVRLSGTIEFDKIDDYENFVAQTERQIIINVTKADSFSLKIDLPRVVYTAFPLGMSDRGRQTVNLEGTGRYHTGSASAVEITLTTINSYFG
jgi:hypothetical protein